MSLQSLVTTVAAYWQRVQTTLFPYLDTAGVALTPELEHLVALLDLLRIEELVPRRLYRVGGIPKDRALLARAFVAKHALHQSETKAFRARLLTDASLRRICGWSAPAQVPSASTFSRAFAVFADLGLADLVHAQRVQEWLGDTLIWHQALDATDIAARESPQPNPAPQYGRTASGKRRKHPVSGHPTGRPPKGVTVAKPLTRIERQLTQVPEIALLELPMACDTGCKPDAQQHLHYWVGYKFHVVTNEWGIPLCAVTTAASVHDSQVAIPLLQLTARRVTALYDLMDAGYDAAAIRACSQALGHVPIIRVGAPAHGSAPAMEPDRARQYKGRTVAERFNARLKDEAGGRAVRVRGVRKVHTHLMFGLLVIFADALLHLAT
jgi:hypothetical protein